MEPASGGRAGTRDIAGIHRYLRLDQYKINQISLLPTLGNAARFLCSATKYIV